MKNYFIFLLTFLSCFSHASDPALFYTSGTKNGQPVKNTGFLAIETICYTGNPSEVMSLLIDMAYTDIEKDDFKVKLNKKNQSIIEFSYVSTKCTDEGTSARECTVKGAIFQCEE